MGITKTRNNTRARWIMVCILITLASSFIYAMSCGIRNNYGIMLDAILKSSGISFVSISFVFAVGQLIYGMVQPAFGIMAEKKGSALTLVFGVALMIAGMLLTPFCKSVFSLTLCLGILLPAGTGALSYGIIIGAITPRIPERMLSMVSGIINASSGIGNTVMSPLINALIAAGGLLHSMVVFTIPAVLMIPLSYWIGKGKKGNESETDGVTKDSSEAFQVKKMFIQAFQSRTYIYLLIGFFTCGFHMAIITNHLPTAFTSYGFSQEASAYIFSIYGMTTILGSILSGIYCRKWKMKNVLGMFYGARPIIVLLFLLLPKTLHTLCAFAALLGFTGSSTVPPVSGIVGKAWGARSMATLFGFVFFIHQIGGFFSAWLGGVCFEAMNSYGLIWVIDILLSVLAAVVSFMIQE